ncbi:hypothetical protein A0256_20470 [Mucilaginibacter sp. PAMC 26640]|nr:hypothetical protein A0256_20470 [Mucilaginibacter sp. PAMC 26640]
MHQQYADYWVHHLNLQPHPEGGFYKEVFRSNQQVTRAGETGLKHACTSIYYLLEGEDFSGFHRIQSDEIWYFHIGDPLHIHVINHQGEHHVLELSNQNNGSLSHIVPAGLWFASEIPSKKGYALVSCAVAPGFEFSEFEMANKNKLRAEYPGNDEVFERLCR